MLLLIIGITYASFNIDIKGLINIKEVLEPAKITDLETYSKYSNNYIITSSSFNFLTDTKETQEVTYRLRLWNESVITSSSISISGGTYEYTVNVETIVNQTTPEYCFRTSDSTITNYYCYSGNSKGYETITDVVIPSEINSVTITIIGHHAFMYSSLTSVEIPNSVITIGGSAFQGTYLTTITIPSSVTMIETQAFAYNCLTSVTIPNSVTTIGYNAFYNNNLTSVKIKGKSSSSDFTSYGINI